ncbi:ElyC/SanA/YdcF family protein [Streptomyces scopuliridis]|uniref:YdcF family protein n=1 Tax=Streptomyces scopuliridis TaxID=452529 RepID=UPI00369CE0F3
MSTSPRGRLWTVVASSLAVVSLLVGVNLSANAAQRDTATNAQAQTSAKCAIQLSSPLPMPAPKADGRGAVMDGMQPDYARSYARDPELADEVVAYRRWQWSTMYRSLDARQKAAPDDLDVYRLQADAYLVNSSYDQALAQLDQIVRREPDDIQALAVTSLIQSFMGNGDDARCRVAHLKRQSAAAADDLSRFIKTTDANQYATYGSEPSAHAVPDAIAVFGQSPNADGTPSEGLLTRLTKTKEMADRFPDAWIVVSGAAVRTQYAEADVMYDWLVQQGVDPARIIKDDRARDTVGNAMGMVAAFQQYDLHNILAVGTVQHLPRAVTTLKALADRYQWKIKVDAAGGGTAPEPSTQVGERRYTYVTAARAAGLFELDDFAKYTKR